MAPSAAQGGRPLHELMGLRALLSPAVLFCPLALTAVLFACPLGIRLREEGAGMMHSARGWGGALADALAAGDVKGAQAVLAAPFGDEYLWMWRNLVVAPISEEVGR